MARPRPPRPVTGSRRHPDLDLLRSSDPVLGRLIESIGPDAVADPRRGYPREHYAGLLRAILGQQVSVRAATAMHQRLLARYGGRAPTPAEVLTEDPETLRAAGGLSRAKLASLRSLAEHVVDGRLDLGGLEVLDDEQVLAALTAVRGIGPWTAQIFLMLGLERPDVVAPGDLGIRRALMIADGRSQLPDPVEVLARAEVWRPQRTLACRVLWASVAVRPL
ncbi:MAG: DNA-3-methyladenine glycosylase 2 family protein [Actinomycetota bacterium]|nr:DNA-3-methyladenine glycosylase 2 family protein [Actinomycetota bacterium]